MTLAPPSRLPGQQLRRQDLDHGGHRRPAGRLHPPRLARRELERLRRVFGLPGELQPGGGLPAAQRDPHQQAPPGAQSQAGALRSARLRPDGQHHLHDRPEQSAGDPPHPPHAGGRGSRTGPTSTSGTTPTWKCSTTPSACGRTWWWRRGPTASATGASRFNSDPSRRLYGTVYYSPQTFFDGDRTDYSASAGFRLTSQLGRRGGVHAQRCPPARGRLQRRHRVVPHRLRALADDDAAPPSRSTTRLTDQWSTAGRFNYIYRPGSDIYIVYDELRRNVYDNFGRYNEFASFRERQLIVKVTYLFSR